MQQLVLKDVYTQKIANYVMCIFWFIILTGFFTDGNPTKHMILLAILATWLSITSNENAKSSFDSETVLMSSLPVTRQEIVLAKYLAGAMWFGLSAIAVNVYVFLFDTFAPFPTRMMHFDEMVIAFSGFLFLLAIFYPVLYRAGYNVAMIVLLIVWGSSLMALQIGANMLANPGLVGFHQFVETLSGMWLLIVILFISGSFLATLISYFISLRIFEKKDIQ